MVILSQIYTRGGDQGRTSLGDGTRVAKHTGRVAAYGTVDEANATIGLVRLHTTGAEDAMLARIQNDLFDLGADLCRPGSDFDDAKALRIRESQVERLEREIDAMNAELQPLTSFVLPGGSAGRRLPASRPHRDAAQRAADLRAGRGRGGQSGGDPLFEPTIGSSVRSVALAEPTRARPTCFGFRAPIAERGAPAPIDNGVTAP